MTRFVEIARGVFRDKSITAWNVATGEKAEYVDWRQNTETQK